jgi:hypothetical protein
MAERKPLWRRFYEAWLEVAARFGEVQTLVVVALVYAIAVGPVALVLAATRQDLLHKRELHAAGSAWNDADTVKTPDLERAKRLF